jgi:hypothetical protein
MTRQIPLKSFRGTHFDVLIGEIGVKAASLGPLINERRRMQSQSASDAAKPGTLPRQADTP